MKNRCDFTFKEYSDAIDYWEKMCKARGILNDITLEALYEEVWQFFPQECVEAEFAK